MANVVPKLTETPGRIRFAGQMEIGQENDEIYARLGLSADEIQELKRDAVI
jgi:crotonobetainyl-CoA:carnitine CoA-transferase CaiB-like acyl-CoA transferase